MPPVQGEPARKDIPVLDLTAAKPPRWQRARKALIARRPGGMARGLMAAKPRSVDEQVAYARSKRWVPPGHEDGLAAWAGTLFHRLIGVPGVALGNAISGASQSPAAFVPVFLTFLTWLASAIWLALH